MKYGYILFATMIVTASSIVSAKDLTVDAAIGGAVGGAIGGALGAELGGRDGAIIGAGIGGAAGTAINTRDHHDVQKKRSSYGYHAPSHGHFCPPGQAKKGRC